MNRTQQNRADAAGNVQRIGALFGPRLTPLPGFELDGTFQEELPIDSIGGYAVPVDPSELTNCDGCQ